MSDELANSGSIVGYTDKDTYYWEDEHGLNYIRLMNWGDESVLQFAGFLDSSLSKFPKACIVTREQAAVIALILQRFAETGEL